MDGTNDDGAVLLRTDCGGVATLTLNRPESRNALSVELMRSMQAELDTISRETAVRVVVIGAEGPAFCSGHDLQEIRDNPVRAAHEALFKRCSDLMMSILRLPQPVIARVHGTATAAGCQLVASCDLAVASKTARFATPGVNIGLFCSTPMVAISRNVPRKQMMEMLLTGDAIDASTARTLGLVNRVVPAERLDTEILELCRGIISKSPVTLRIGKQAFYRQLDLPVEDAYDHASQVMVENMLTRDADEGIEAFLAKRTPNWSMS